jgi:subfamily B ATP-binding cassette protein MsbA
MIAVGVPSMVLMAVTEPALPILLKLILDGTSVKPEHELLALVPLMVMVFFAMRGGASYCSRYAFHWVNGRLVADLRVAIFERLLMLPTRYYADHSSEDLVANVISDTSRAVDTVTTAVTALARDGLTIIALLAWMLYLDWRSALLALSMIPVIMLIVRSSSEPHQTSDLDASPLRKGMIRLVQESIRNHKVIKLDGGQQYQRQRFKIESDRVQRINLKQAADKSFRTAVMHLTIGVMLAIVISPAAQQTATDGGIGSFVSLSLAMLLLILPVRRMTFFYLSRQQGLQAATSVFALLEEVPEMDSGTVDVGRVRGELTFEQVGLCGQSPISSVGDEITQVLHPGERMQRADPAIADLATRFSKPSHGRILLDGHDLATLTLANLRANIAWISRELTLFNDTVAANIAYGGTGHATEVEIISAMHASHAAEFIRELPQGLQTVVGEGGVDLSEEQRLHIVIARAFLKDPSILILEEGVTASDQKSGRQVQAALESLMQGRTSIMIRVLFGTKDSPNPD